MTCEQPLLRSTRISWAERQASLAAHYDWVLFDVPQRLQGHATLGPCLFPIQVAEADAACHVLLLQQGGKRPLLVNRFDPGSQLQRDLLLIWRKTLCRSSAALDRAQRRSRCAKPLAFKQPVGQYAPASLAAQDALSLATWCLARRREVT